MVRKLLINFINFYNLLGTIAVQQSSIVKNVKCTERICICIYLFLLIGIIAILSIKNILLQTMPVLKE